MAADLIEQAAIIASALASTANDTNAVFGVTHASHAAWKLASDIAARAQRDQWKVCKRAKFGHWALAHADVDERRGPSMIRILDRDPAAHDTSYELLVDGRHVSLDIRDATGERALVFLTERQARTLAKRIEATANSLAISMLSTPKPKRSKRRG